MEHGEAVPTLPDAPLSADQRLAHGALVRALLERHRHLMGLISRRVLPRAPLVLAVLLMLVSVTPSAAAVVVVVAPAHVVVVVPVPRVVLVLIVPAMAIIIIWLASSAPRIGLVACIKATAMAPDIVDGIHIPNFLRYIAPLFHLHDEVED